MANLSDYIVNFTSLDTLNSVTGRGATTTNDITIGNLTSTGIDDNATSTAITIDSSQKATFSNSVEATIAYRAYDSVGAAYRNVLRYDSGDVRLETGSAGSEEIKVYTAGSERMRIDSSGNVGIGTTSPAGNSLTIEKSTVARLRLAESGVRSWDMEATSGSWRINNATNSLEAMRIDSSGNVGIGTAAPDSKLQITTGTNNIIQHRDATHSTLTNVTSAITFSRTDGIDDLSAIMGWNDGGIALSGREGIAFATGGGVGYSSTVERMRIDSSGDVFIKGGGQLKVERSAASNFSSFYTDTADSTIINNSWSNQKIVLTRDGNVGIGTTSPALASGWSTALHVNGSGSGAHISLTDTTTGATNTDGLVVGQYQANSYFINRENGFQAFYTNNAERMRIDSSGRVGIGMTNPDYVAVVSDATSATRLVVENTANGSAGSGVYMRVYSGGSLVSTSTITNDNVGNLKFFTGTTTASERMRIDSSGNLLVGTTTTVGTGTEGVQIGTNGSIITGRNQTSDQVHHVFKNPNGTVGTIRTLNNATSYVTSSDERLKENIVDAPAGNIDAIRVRSFDWKADGSHQTYGMVAQELVDVAPEAVSQGQTEDDMWGVDYSKLVPMMIKEIQDLKAEVAALKGE